MNAGRRCGARTGVQPDPGVHQAREHVPALRRAAQQQHHARQAPGPQPQHAQPVRPAPHKQRRCSAVCRQPHHAAPAGNAARCSGRRQVGRLPRLAAAHLGLWRRRRRQVWRRRGGAAPRLCVHQPRASTCRARARPLHAWRRHAAAGGATAHSRAALRGRPRAAATAARRRQRGHQLPHRAAGGPLHPPQAVLHGHLPVPVGERTPPCLPADLHSLLCQ